jgi:hypothetical protein
MGERLPHEAFATLGDESRIEIMRAIAEAQATATTAEPAQVELAFSEIYDRVDVDGTSKLSYHLGELTGTFLRKGENGYSFTHAGEQIVRIVLSGNYEQPPAYGPIETDGRCPFCESESLESELNHQYFSVHCRECERPVAGHPVTPAQIRSFDESTVPDVVARKMAAQYRQIRQGICIGCSGRLSTELVGEEDLPPESRYQFLVRDRCQHCLRRYNSPLVYCVAYHPASVAFHWEHGIDMTATGMWELAQVADEHDWHAERVSEDPDEFRVVLKYDDDTLHLSLDSDAEVTRTERVRGRQL